MFDRIEKNRLDLAYHRRISIQNMLCILLGGAVFSMFYVIFKISRVAGLFFGIGCLLTFTILFKRTSKELEIISKQIKGLKQNEEE